MAIVVSTSDPSGFLQSIRTAIDEHRILTWSYDSDGDFTYAVAQWENRAWLRPETARSSITFSIVGPQNVGVSSDAYAIYHSRFIEMLLLYLDSGFETAQATALATSADDVDG